VLPLERLEDPLALRDDRIHEQPENPAPLLALLPNPRRLEKLCPVARLVLALVPEFDRIEVHLRGVQGQGRRDLIRDVAGEGRPDLDRRFLIIRRDGDLLLQKNDLIDQLQRRIALLKIFPEIRHKIQGDLRPGRCVGNRPGRPTLAHQGRFVGERQRYLRITCRSSSASEYRTQT
jgi:hypothetical protein